MWKLTLKFSILAKIQKILVTFLKTELHSPIRKSKQNLRIYKNTRINQFSWKLVNKWSIMPVIRILDHRWQNQFIDLKSLVNRIMRIRRFGRLGEQKKKITWIWQLGMLGEQKITWIYRFRNCLLSRKRKLCELIWKAGIKGKK